MTTETGGGAQSAVARIGRWIFVVGLVGAGLDGLFPSFLDSRVSYCLLFSLGALVGITQAMTSESSRFLLASVALLLVCAVNWPYIPQVGLYIRALIANLAVFVGPAAVIVALKTILVPAVRASAAP